MIDFRTSEGDQIRAVWSGDLLLPDIGIRPVSIEEYWLDAAREKVCARVRFSDGRVREINVPFMALQDYRQATVYSEIMALACRWRADA